MQYSSNKKNRKKIFSRSLKKIGRVETRNTILVVLPNNSVSTVCTILVSKVVLDMIMHDKFASGMPNTGPNTM